MKHGDIVRECLKALNNVGWVAWKSPTAKLRLAHGGWFYSGRPGLVDICAIIPPNGRLLGVECKTPDDDVRPDQDEFMDLAGRNGAFCVVIRNANEMQCVIDYLKQNPELRAEDL